MSCSCNIWFDLVNICVFERLRVYCSSSIEVQRRLNILKQPYRSCLHTCTFPLTRWLLNSLSPIHVGWSKCNYMYNQFIIFWGKSTFNASYHNLYLKFYVFIIYKLSRSCFISPRFWNSTLFLIPWISPIKEDQTFLSNSALNCAKCQPTSSWAYFQIVS